MAAQIIVESLLEKLPYYSKSTAKFGKGKGTAIYIVLSVIAVILIVRGGKVLYNAIKEKFKEYEDEQELKDYLANQVTQTQDDVPPTDPEIQAFESQAQFIADSQAQAMEAEGTNEESLFNQLIDLTGWQLVMVADAFGMRPYPSTFGGSEQKSIFGWYDEELCENCTWCLSYSHENVEGCEPGEGDFWCSSCNEREFMRAIWRKSGIPN